MKRLIFPIVIFLGLFTACNLEVDVDRYLFAGDVAELDSVPAEGGVVGFSFSWSGCIWAVYENIPAGRDSLVKEMYPCLGGGYSSYGSTRVMMDIAPNTSTSQRETEIIVCTIEYEGHESEQISESFKVIQKGAELKPEESSD